MLDIKHLLYLAPLAGVAFADLGLDRDDVPPPCRDICQPIVDLTRRCDVDLPGDNDRQEDLLERQCVCTNNSFDVQRIAGLCASCFQQNFRAPDDDNDDDDDNDTQWDDNDIREIMRDCAFSSASYNSQLSAAAATVNVVATAPTATNQLTTTIGRGSNSNNPQPTQTNSGSGSSNDDDDNNNNNNNNSGDGNASQTTSNGGAGQTSNNNPEETGLAMPGAVPLGGYSAAAVMGVFGAMVAGGALLL